MRLIERPSAAFTLPYLYTSLVVWIAFGITGHIYCKESYVTMIMVPTLCLACSASYFTADLKTLLFSLLGFQCGLLFAVFTLGLATDYSIHWTLVSVFSLAYHLSTFIFAFSVQVHRERKQIQALSKSEQVNPSDSDPTA